MGAPITSYFLNKNNPLQSVMTVPMDMTVPTTVVDTVWTTIHVTNRLDIVTGDVIRDIQTVIVAKVNLPITVTWCNDKTYGYVCINVSTIGHCLNNSPCNITTWVRTTYIQTHTAAIVFFDIRMQWRTFWTELQRTL